MIVVIEELCIDMITTFQIILIIMMCISFLGAMGDEQMSRVMSLTSICIASVIAFIVSVMWL